MRKSVSMGLVVGLLGMGLATAEIKINDQLSLSGFVDMSSTYNNAAFTPAGTAADEFTGTLDQFELDFMFKLSDKLSARVDLSNSAVEQGFISYAASSALTLQAGKFLSVSGWEAAEPTGMYQYDYNNAYVYGLYQNGVSASYTVSPMVAVYGALVDDIWAADGNLSRPGVEAQVALMPTKEITIKATNLFQQQSGYIEDVVNVWASYTMGALTAAVEGDYLSNYDWDRADLLSGEDNNGFGGLVMANYKLSDVYAVTGRFSMIDTDLGGTHSEVTVSPSVTLMTNWFALAQAKYQIDDEELGFAIETTVTF